MKRKEASTGFFILRHILQQQGMHLQFKGGDFSMYVIQHCFICRPSDSAVSEDARIEPRTVATSGH
jgi:hypothetical protein